VIVARRRRSTQLQCPSATSRWWRAFPNAGPVVVFDTEEGLLLADGYHRVAAALKEGRKTVEAEVRSGSRHDALEYAAGIGAARRHVSLDEAKRHIMRWNRL
jgi:hypothetical protein